MYLYWTKKERLFAPDIGEYVSFGIGAWKICPKLWAGAEPSFYIPDISTDGRAVRRLAIRCTLGRLDPQQLADVVEDFLG